MAEKPSELRSDEDILEIDRANTGANSVSASDAFLEKYSDDYSTTPPRETSADVPEETEHLKAQIEETRSQLGDTIDAIQEKLSLQNISDQVKEQVSEQISSAIETAKDTVYDATIKKAGKFMQSMNKTVNQSLDEMSKSGAVQTARENPLALSLIGLGFGLLLMSGYKRTNKSTYRYAYNKKRSKGAYPVDGETRNQQSSALRSAQNKISDTASGAYDSVSNAATGAYESVSNVAGSAYSGVTNAASTAVDGVSSAASNAYGSVTNAATGAYEKVGEYGTQAREQYDYYIEENPLAVGAVALALGAAVGLAFPSTRYEGQLMGETKQNLLNLAQDRAGELVDKVKQVAGEAQKTIGDEVKAQGLKQ